MVVTLEFDRLRTATGTPERDRLDILGLDCDGRLVVAELKRDIAPTTPQPGALRAATGRRLARRLQGPWRPLRRATAPSPHLNRRRPRTVKGETLGARAASDIAAKSWATHA
jgi:hypothetical protein